jgi:chorismate mutase / prephenate dehydratase
MANERESLDDLRREIDEIDERVHDLLINRAGLVERIRAVKRLESIATVRPGREALILRKLIARHQGRFPIGAITRIWREIIAGITRMEMSSYAVAVYAAEGDQGYWDIARDQFGSVTPMTPYSSPRDVLRIVDEGNASLGIVPVPRDDDTDPWWISLMIPDGLRVAYKLPFINGTNARSTSNGTAVAFAFGRILPEPTGDDRTLIVIETENPVSRAALNSFLERAKLPSQIIASSQQGTWFHLAAVEDFVTDNDARLETLNTGDEISRTVIIGSYAEPPAPENNGTEE